jgi:myo-inositol-1(or 4)-monophosphatase
VGCCLIKRQDRKE